MTTLRANPSTWVTRAIAKNWERISNHVEDPLLMPLESGAKAQGKNLVITIPEYGCGAYGCVMPTKDEDVVFKITTDETEAEFIEKVLPTIDPPAGLVDYLDVLRLEGHHRNRPLYAVWREEAQDVGEIMEAAATDEEAERVDDLIYLQKSGGDTAFFLLQKAGAKRAELYANALAARTEARQLILPVRLGADSPIPGLMDSYKGDPAMQIALCLAFHEAAAELLSHDHLAGTIGDALLSFLSQGILIGDAHGGNVGRVVRDGTSLWVITDPGHVAVLGTPWRPKNARKDASAEQAPRENHDGYAKYGTPTLRTNPGAPSASSPPGTSISAVIPPKSQRATRAQADQLLEELVPLGVSYMLDTCGTFTSCGNTSAAVAEAATIAGVPTLLVSDPGHFYNVIPLREGGGLVVDITQKSFSLPYGSPRDAEDDDEGRAEMKAAFAAARRDPWSVVLIEEISESALQKKNVKMLTASLDGFMTMARLRRLASIKNPATTITLDRGLVARMKKSPGEYQTLAEKIDQAALEVAKRGQAREDQVYLALVMAELGSSVERMGGTIAALESLKWLRLGHMIPIDSAESAAYLDSELKVGKKRFTVVQLPPGTMKGRRVIGAPEPVRAAPSGGFRADSRQDAQRFLDTAVAIAAAGGGFEGSERVYLASVTDKLGTTVPAISPALEAWHRAGWVELARNDMPLPKYQDLFDRSEQGTPGTTRVRHFIIAEPAPAAAPTRRAPAAKLEAPPATFSGSGMGGWMPKFLAAVKHAMDSIHPEEVPPDVVQRTYGSEKVFLFAIRDAIGLGIDDFHIAILTALREGQIAVTRMDLPGALNDPTRRRMQFETIQDRGSQFDLAVRGSVVIDEGPVAVPATFERDFAAAFDELERQSRFPNYQVIHDVRVMLPQYTKAQFDSGLDDLRRRRLFSYDSAQGQHHVLTEAQRKGGLRQGHEMLTLVQRRDPRGY